ncbi:DoxX family protein [Salinimicrobium sp. CDJ15-81-2]|nr:DoxX family protein [Salinimicrobium nanhaiense]
MNTFTNTNFKTSQVDLALLILRVGVGVLMLTHGIPKLQMLFAGGEIQFPGVLGLSPAVSLALAVFAEVVCSILLIIGLGTRWASIPLIVTMLVAVLLVHGSDPFANQEPGLLYLFLYLPLLILGGGRYSLDHLINTAQRPQLAKS